MSSQTGNPPNGNLSWSDLSSQQIDQRAFQEATDTYRVDISAVEATVVLPVAFAGLNVLGSFNIPYTAISTGSPYTITAGLPGNTKQLLLSDTTGQTEKITFGSSFFFTNPGCEREYDVLVPAGTPITIQSQEASNPTAGNYILTALG
jgi:hypothetical protein